MSRRPSLRPWAILLLVVALLGASCGGDDDSSDVAAEDKVTTTTRDKAATAGTTPSSAADEATSTAFTPTTSTARKLSGEITVLAAASLTEAFTEIGKAFEAANPGAGVKFSFASSSALALQANNGAPADLFASADDVNMKKVTDAGNAGSPRTFTRNRLAILVQKGNPLGLSGLADFDRSDVRYVICKDGVPCGTYSKEALTKAGVTRREVSQEADVKAVVAKVTNQQADAGIVYVTDAKAAASSSDTIDIPDDLNVVAGYPIATLKQSGKPDVANAFIDFVLGPAGQDVLAKYGFLAV